MAEELALQWTCPNEPSEIRLERLIREKLAPMSWNRARQLITSGKISVNGHVVLEPTVVLVRGDKIVFNPRARNGTLRPSATVPIVHVDSQLIVVNKPPGISTVPYDRNERGTLYQLVRGVLSNKANRPPAPLHVVHRIDKETSGLVVFARTHSALLRLKQLFRRHDIERRYLAVVHGHVGERTFRSRLVVDRGDGKRGSTRNPKLGREAITHVTPLESFESATLLLCTLETGRTHQIRIHLAEAGFPLLGERVYSKMQQGSTLRPPRLMLHAQTLGFMHPLTEQRMSFAVDPPVDMTSFLRELRGR